MVQLLPNRDVINQILKGTASIAPDALSMYEKRRQEQKQQEQDVVKRDFEMQKLGQQQTFQKEQQDRLFQQQRELQEIKERARPKPVSPLETFRQKELYKQLDAIDNEIINTEQSVANLGKIEELIDKTGGFTGYIKAALGTESAAELSSLGLAAIEPIIKLFNPVGAIPVAKINLIKDKFAISPWDFSSTSKGKVNALRRLYETGLQRAQRRKQLVEQKLQGKDVDLKSYDKESNELIDSITQEEEAKIKNLQKDEPSQKTDIPEEIMNGLPDASLFDGKTIQGPEGVKLQSKGGKWVQI